MDILRRSYRTALTLVALAVVCLGMTAQAQTPAPSSVVISEFRFIGPTGTTDEFVELYNNTDAPVTVADASPPATGQAGWAVVASGERGLLFVIPEGTVIPARGHFLGVRKNIDLAGDYSLDAYPAGNTRTATGDATYTTHVYEAGGVARFNTANPSNFTLEHRMDAVGHQADPIFAEGRPLPGPGLRRTESSGYRDLSSGSAKDTNDNAADFIWVDTDTRLSRVGLARHGAPGPENLSSPRVNNAVVGSLLDPSRCAGCAPNRVRSATPDPAHPQCSALGTLAFRRRYTNTTGQPVTRLRFRVVDITTLGSPGYASGTQADLRVLSSTPTAIQLSTGELAAVQGTTLEQPPLQPACGGYNSSLSVGAVTLVQPLPPGASIDVELLTGVMRGGAFRFFVQTEALP